METTTSPAQPVQIAATPQAVRSTFARVRSTRIWKIFSSIRTFLSVAIAIVVSSLIGTLIPQGESFEAYVHSFGVSGANLIGRLGLNDLYHTWWFNLLLVLLAANTAACAASRLSIFRRRPGVFVTHVSILVILAGALIRGTFGHTGYLQMHEGEIKNQFMTNDNTTLNLPFQVKLEKFFIEYYVPETHLFHVMHKEGWHKSVAITALDKPVPIEGEPYKLKILKFVPDLVVNNNGEITSRSSRPNNPAALVEISAPDIPPQQRWIFQNFPAMNASPDSPLSFVYSYNSGQIKDFKSHLKIFQNNNRLAVEKTIEVNNPVSFKGYTLYQSGYDPADPTYSSFQVSKDPGVPLVYLGFLLLPLGLAYRFYIEPKLNQNTVKK